MLTVVGSGPAGVACAHALAARGHRVEVIDGGREVNPADAAVYEQLAATPNWDAELAQQVRSGTHRAFESQLTAHGARAGTRAISDCRLPRGSGPYCHD